MSFKRDAEEKLRALSAELGEDDGGDPREFFREGKYPRKANRKALQLCGQVFDLLSQILSGECGDEVLRSLQVVSVAPAPDASQLLVLVAQIQGESHLQASEVLSRLNNASGMLRSLVAAGVTRRRAPKLLFRVVAMRAETEANT